MPVLVYSGNGISSSYIVRLVSNKCSEASCAARAPGPGRLSQVTSCQALCTVTLETCTPAAHRQPITRSHFCRNQSKAKFTNFARRGVLNLREKETWQSKNKFETEEKHLHGKGKVMLQILIYKRTEWFFDQALKRRHWTWWVRRILVRQQPLLHPATKRVHNHFYCNLATTETAAFGKYGPGP